MNDTAGATPSRAILISNITGFVVFSILGIISSLVTVVVIATSKALHSPCFTLIAGGGIGSLLVALHYLTRGIDKIGLELGVFGFERTGLKCLLLTGVLGIWGIAFHAQMACLIAIDRLISVTAPLKYRQLGQRYALGMTAGCAILVTIQEVIGFFTSPNLYIPMMCTEFMDALHPLYILTYAKINLAYCVINVLSYLGMMICFRYRHKFCKDVAAFQDTFMKQQLAVMPTVKLMVLLYLVTGVLAELLVNIGLMLPMDEPAFIFIMLGTILKDASSLVEGFALLVRNRKFRKCFRELLGWRENTITATNTSTVLTSQSQR